VVEDDNEDYLCIVGNDVGQLLSSMEHPNEHNFGEDLDLVGEDAPRIIGFFDTNDPDEEDGDEEIDTEIYCGDRSCPKRVVCNNRKSCKKETKN